MSLTNKIKAEALDKALGDPRVAVQIQKNTEKLLRGKQKETFIIAREAIKSLLDTKYDDFIKTAIMSVIEELKSDLKDIISSRVEPNEQILKKDT